MYQFAPRVSAVVCLLASAWLTPTASSENRATMTEVITRVVEVCEEMLSAGCAENWSSVHPEGDGRPWKFNSVLDIVVGTLLFGMAANKPGPR